MPDEATSSPAFGVRVPGAPRSIRHAIQAGPEIGDLVLAGHGRGRPSRGPKVQRRRTPAATSTEDRFRALYGDYSPALLAYLRRRCRSEADAQDALAETFVVAWRRLDCVPEGDSGRLWLYAVARRVLANQRRGQRRRDQLTTRLATAPIPDGSDDAERLEDVLALVAAVARLPPKDREILLLAARDDLSHAEIAVALGCSENASAIRLRRARERLVRTFQKEDNAWRTPAVASGPST